MPVEPALEMIQVSRRFRSGDEAVSVLDDLELRVAAGERIAVMGASGSGKSTLLHLAAGMDIPDTGQVRVSGHDLSAAPEPERSRFRAAAIGLVFQDFNLLDSLNVFENIELPLWLNRIDPARSPLEKLVTDLGIDHLTKRLPEQLSGGEKQRVAIARALVHEPALLLADEPTGSLDQATAATVLELFDQITRTRGCALVLVTHNPEAAAVCDRTLYLKHGRLSVE